MMASTPSWLRCVAKRIAGFGVVFFLPGAVRTDHPLTHSLTLLIRLKKNLGLSSSQRSWSVARKGAKVLCQGRRNCGSRFLSFFVDVAPVVSDRPA